MLRRAAATTTLLIATLIAVTIAVPASAASVSTPTARTAKACGSFKETYRYRVSASRGLKCRFALRIVKSFIRSRSSWRKRSIDGTVAGTHYTNRKFKGWRCFEGSGGGSCSKRRRSAGYQN